MHCATSCKSLEMRAKSVWRIQICLLPIFLPHTFFTKKHMNLRNFWNTLWLFFVQDLAVNLWIEERNQPKRFINEWVQRCETEHVLRKSSNKFQWDERPGASEAYWRRKHIQYKYVPTPLMLNKYKSTN